MGNPRVGIIRNELISVLKPLIGIAVIIGGGVIPFIIYTFERIESFWLSLVAILLAIIAVEFMVILRLSKKASLVVWYDREYLLLRNRWKYKVNKDFQSLIGECEGERRLKCLNGTISHLSIEVGPAETFMPFDPNEQYDVQLCPESNRDRGAMSLRQPHRKEGASFAFRIDFNPPLKRGEEAYLKFRYRLPRFKIANMELLREKVSTAKLEVREYEYNSFAISYDVHKFVYEIIFDSSCKVKPKGLEVLRGTDVFHEEQEHIATNNLFRCEQDDGSWRMILEREHPPAKANYRIKWTPPKIEELHQYKRD